MCTQTYLVLYIWKQDTHSRLLYPLQQIQSQKDEMRSHSSFHTLKWRKGLSQENMPFYLLIMALSSLPRDCLSNMAQILVLCWTWTLLSEAAPKKNPNESWCFFLLLLSRKYCTIHKKAGTSEKCGSKPVTAKCSSVLPAVTAGPGSWRLLMRLFAATACTDIDLQVQFRCLSMHNALR